MRTNVLRGSAVVAIAAALVTFTSLEASALVCQHASVGAGGFGQEAAIQSWRNQVMSKYGAGWSDFNLAKNKIWSEQNFGVTTLNSITATPCQNLTIRHLPPNSLIPLQR